MEIQYIRGQVVDVFTKRIFAAELTIRDQKITDIRELELSSQELPYIIPGFIDSHVHIESSMLVPSEFARLAVIHGTVATVSDPHEIANVCGMKGVDFMIENGKSVPFKFNFGAPSCVPATIFETAGADINPSDVAQLLDNPEIKYLSEMMNFPGIIAGNPEVLQKVSAAHQRNKPVDGHAPGLRGRELRKYIEAGISSDHECFTEEEAREKLELGMKILIREGSAAKNFAALIPLLNDYPEMMMFCSDDKHPDSLVQGHINILCARAIARGIDVFKVLQAACINPVIHYKLDVGLLRVNDHADFCIVEDLINFRVLATYINGLRVAESGRSLIELAQHKNIVTPINNFNCKKIESLDLIIHASEFNGFPVIEALDGQLITTKSKKEPIEKNGILHSNLENDVLKIVVINRYTDAPVAKAFITNFELKEGAIASSVAHDSHNILAVGVSDEDIAKAVNLVIESEGGISCVSSQIEILLPLPVGGLMSFEDGHWVAEQYTAIDAAAKALGSGLGSPFMTLSFMALLVIPFVKLSDKGLFDGEHFRFFGSKEI